MMKQEISPPEGKVLECLCRGLSNKHIAKELGVSENTVKTHLARISVKFGTEGRSKIAIKAVELGYGKDLPDISLDSLPPRRREVAHYLGQGLENDEIATKMDIDVASVKTHIQLIYRDLALPVNDRSLIAAMYTKSQLSM